jgi:hypothetical protein
MTGCISMTGLTGCGWLQLLPFLALVGSITLWYYILQYMSFLFSFLVVAVSHGQCAAYLGAILWTEYNEKVLVDIGPKISIWITKLWVMMRSTWPVWDSFHIGKVWRHSWLRLVLTHELVEFEGGGYHLQTCYKISPIWLSWALVLHLGFSWYLSTYLLKSLSMLLENLWFVFLAQV